jgi:hypothetical protein
MGKAADGFAEPALDEQGSYPNENHYDISCA